MPRLIRTERNVYIGESQADPLAKIDFSRSTDGTYVIQHTYVSETLTGQGVGRLLVQEVVDLARESGHKILPLCPYARRVLTKDPTSQDVVAELPPLD